MSIGSFLGKILGTADAGNAGQRQMSQGIDFVNNQLSNYKGYLSDVQNKVEGHLPQELGYVTDAKNNIGNNLSSFLNYTGGINNTILNNASPYITAGQQGLNNALDLINNPDQITNNPAVQYQFKTGFNNMQQKYAAGGKLMSGQAMKDLYDYSQNFYQGALTNAVNRSLGIGQAGASVTNATGSALANNTGTVGSLFGNTNATNATLAGEAGSMYGNTGSQLVNLSGNIGNVYSSAMGNVVQGYGNMAQIAYNSGMAPANFLSSAINSGAMAWGMKQ